MKNTNDSELIALKSTLHNLSILKPFLHQKILHTGRLYEIALSSVNIETKKEYILAGYYCNIGFLMIEESLYKDKYTTSNDIGLIQRHNLIAADLMHEKGFNLVGDIIKLHHEKPNGTGYLKIQQKEKYIGLLCLVDEFIDSVVYSRKPEPVLTVEEAIGYAFKHYDNGLMFSQAEVKILKELFLDYYKSKIRQ